MRIFFMSVVLDLLEKLDENEVLTIQKIFLLTPAEEQANKISFISDENNIILSFIFDKIMYFCLS